MKTSIAIIFFFLTSISNLLCQTNAHRNSTFAIVDPIYSSDVNRPQLDINPSLTPWIYGPSEFECWRLQKLMSDSKAAELDVAYPGTFHIPYVNTSFRINNKGVKGVNLIEFQAIGDGRVYMNDSLCLQFKAYNNNNSKKITIPKGAIIKELRFELSTSKEPPALLIEEGPFSTNNSSWEWKSGQEKWQKAFKISQLTSRVPPHLDDEQTVILKPESNDNHLYDFGRELIGYVTIRSSSKPEMCIGESKKEALDTSNTVIEQTLDFVQLGSFLWRSKAPVALRYVFVPTEIQDIWCEAQFHPVIYKGAFACSDSILTRIWMNSAYTLRLCMRDFIIDGIKRDRLPWAGDLAMSLTVDAYTFADKEIVRRSLVALGRSGIEKTDINGIIDFTLWWIIAQDRYQLYFGDKNHLDSEWNLIKETLDKLTTRCDSSGFLKTENTWLFIDWVNQEKWTALQILWWWAQQSGIRLALREGDIEFANIWQRRSDNLKDQLLKSCWNDKDKCWVGNPVSSENKVKYPNFLAVISGLASNDQFEGINSILTNEKVPSVGTPYMKGFENIALARIGKIQVMLDRTKEYWGGMLKLGATTFWEAYDTSIKGKDQYSFYDRPYGKSLCHGFSAGPAAFLPSEVLGLRPLEDGWKRFSVNPDLGNLKWVDASVPTPFGNIVIEIKNNTMTMNVPAGTTAEWKGMQIAGPKLITEKL